MDQDSIKIVGYVIEATGPTLAAPKIHVAFTRPGSIGRMQFSWAYLTKDVSNMKWESSGDDYLCDIPSNLFGHASMGMAFYFSGNINSTTRRIYFMVLDSWQVGFYSTANPAQGIYTFNLPPTINISLDRWNSFFVSNSITGALYFGGEDELFYADKITAPNEANPWKPANLKLKSKMVKGNTKLVVVVPENEPNKLYISKIGTTNWQSYILPVEGNSIVDILFNNDNRLIYVISSYITSPNMSNLSSINILAYDKELNNFTWWNDTITNKEEFSLNSLIYGNYADCYINNPDLTSLATLDIIPNYNPIFRNFDLNLNTKKLVKTASSVLHINADAEHLDVVINKIKIIGNSYWVYLYEDGRLFIAPYIYNTSGGINWQQVIPTK